MKPIIVTDSCSDLPDALYKEFEIERVKLSYTFGSDSFFDNSIDAETIEFYNKMRAGGAPMTSQVNTQAFLDFFEALIPQNRPIIYIGFSSKLSSTYSCSVVATDILREKYPDLQIISIDSKCASMGLGQVCIYAARLRDEGKSFQEIVDWVEVNAYRSHHWVCVDDLQYLKRGGRLSSAEAFFGSLLSIKPLIWMDVEGHLAPFAKERGRKKVFRAMIDKILENVESPEEQTLFICHSDAPDGVEELREMLAEKIVFKDIQVCSLGVVIGSHVGPGTWALFFMGKDKRTTV